MHIDAYRPKRYDLTGDYLEVWDFLYRHGGQGNLQNWPWPRWEWLMSHSYLTEDLLPLIGIGRQDGRMVALATHDLNLGQAYLLTEPGGEVYLPALLAYAEDHLAGPDGLAVAVEAKDQALRSLLLEAGYRPGDEQEVILTHDLKDLDYELPRGYGMVSLADEDRPQAYKAVIWRGFDHGDDVPPVQPEDDVPRPHEAATLKLFVKAPDDSYAAHCGMWYTPGDACAYVEPVCTVPRYRRMGLGKAAVVEGLRRCRDLGAPCARVISDQEFYLALGFRETARYDFLLRQP